MLAFVLLSAVLAGGDQAEPKGKQLKVVASTPMWKELAPNGRDKRGEVITSAEELAVIMGKPVAKAKEASEQAARMLKVKGIDFDKQALVVIAVGERNTGGYSVQITDVVAEGGKVKVKWKEKTPPPGGFTIQVITYPGVAALIEKDKGAIVFDPELPSGKAKKEK